MSDGRRFFIDNFDSIVFDRPHLFRSLIVFPVIGGRRGPDGGSPLPLHEALAGKSVELLDSGRVELLRLINRSDRKVIGIDGQEVRGGLQNRILTSSVLIGSRSEESLPALCVEERRWEGQDPHFNQGTIAYPTIRTLLAQSTIHRRGNAQESIWRSIRESLKNTGSFSATSSMADLFASFEEDLESAAHLFPCEDEQTGAAVIVGGRYLCVDAFATPSLFKAYFPLLARSYAMDALTHRGGPMEWRNLDNVENVLRSLAENSHEIREKGVVLGEHVLLHSGSFQGRALVHDRETIHMSAFAEL